MFKTTLGARRLGLGACALAALTMVVAAGPASADPIGAGEATAFGATITVGGEEVIPPTPEVTVTMPPGGEESDTVIDIPAEPLAVSGTLNADAVVSEESVIDSELAVNTQEVAGPYNASGVALIEGAEVLLDAVADDVALVTADVIRAEAVAVCSGDTVSYSANSEIINLNIGGEDVPLNEPLEQVIDGLNDLLDQTTLNQVVNIERNVITPTADGIAVDALVVTLLAAAGDDPVAQVRLGHAAVSGVACDDAVAVPAPDAALPGDPAPAPAPAAQPILPTTGADSSMALALAGLLGAGSLGLVALRRRLV